jgi:tetratricopeptide (TPR) repeat protein
MLTHRQFRRWHRRIFPLAAVLASLLLLFLLELGLRIFGYGYPTEFLVPRQIGKRDFYTDNYQFGWRFFPLSLARKPARFAIPAAKAGGTYRIFVLGSSAALGDPDPSYSFGRILEVLLRNRYPNVRFEVVNAAMTAINSHVTLEIIKDCARHQPNLFLVYMGNNEVVGPYGAGTVFGSFSPSLTLIRAGIQVRSTRTGQLIDDVLQRLRSDKGSHRRWAGMEMFLQNQIRADDPRLKAVYDHFRKNLNDICWVGREAGAKILVSTVASNLKDSAPFAALHRTNLSAPQKESWDQLYEAAIVSESAGECGAALQKFRKLEEIDDTFADLHFRMGRCFWALGDYDRARQSYIRARNLDALRFRADSQINEIIRSSLRARNDEGIYLVDAERAFAKGSQHGIPGEDLFLEHVHMNFEGNYLLARTFLEQAVEILSDEISQAETKVGEPLSQEECARRLALTGWDRYRLVRETLKKTNTPPFTNQLDQAERSHRTEQHLESLRIYRRPEKIEGAIAAYRQSLTNAQNDWWIDDNLAKLFQESGNFAGAAEQWRSVLQQLPHYSEAQNNLGVALLNLGKVEEAKSCFNEAARLEPWDPSGYNNLGVAFAKEGKLSDALASYSKALGLRADFPEAHYNVGNLLAEQGRTGEAIFHYSEAIHSRPDYASPYNKLGNLLLQEGKIGEAIDKFSDALRSSPDDIDLHNNLGTVLVRQGKTEEAIDQYGRALEIDPNSALTHYNLGVALATCGNNDGALGHFLAGLRVRPNDADAHYNVGNILAGQGKFRVATEHFSEALKLRPDYAEAHNSLATALAAQGKTDEAVQHYRQALKLSPGSVPALVQLAWILATDQRAANRNAEEALHLAEQANLATNRQHPKVLDTLAAAYAEAGQFQIAISTAERAFALALAAKEFRAASEIQKRLILYQQHRPFRSRQG